MSLRLLLAALHVAVVFSALYVRPLPPGHGIDGIQEMSLTDQGDIAACVEEWRPNPPKIAVFYGTNKTCVGYNRVWGRGDPEPTARSFILSLGSSDMCSANATLDFLDLVECKDGFKRAVHNNQVSCFHLTKRNPSKMGDPEFTNFVRIGCEGWGQPASLLNAEEESAVVDLMSDEVCEDKESTVLLGLLPSPQGYKWMDGSKLEYFRKGQYLTQIDSCTSDECDVVYKYWDPNNISDTYWIPHDFENTFTKPVLCKYTPLMIGS